MSASTKIGISSFWPSLLHFSSVQTLSHVRLFATPWIEACQASLSITNSWSLPKLMSIESVMPPNISSSVVPFSSCPQSLPASEFFPMSQLFAWGGQSTGVSASASFLPKFKPEVNMGTWHKVKWNLGQLSSEIFSMIYTKMKILTWREHYANK